MSAVPTDYQLRPEDHRFPVMWLIAQTSITQTGHHVDVSDQVMLDHFGPGKGKKLRSFGHDPDGVHYLLTRGGTIVHTDRAYTRYTHQLVLRNDGNRLRGLPWFDDPEGWHPPLLVGSMYCLDTHSPHQGLPDDRLNPDRKRPIYKAVIAVDRDEPLQPDQAHLLLRRLLDTQLADWPAPKRPVRPQRNT